MPSFLPATKAEMIVWSALPPVLHCLDLSITRTAGILGLAVLLHDDRVASLMRTRLTLLAPTSGPGCAPVARAAPAAAPQ